MMSRDCWRCDKPHRVCILDSCRLSFRSYESNESSQFSVQCFRFTCSRTRFSLPRIASLAFCELAALLFLLTMLVRKIASWSSSVFLLSACSVCYLTGLARTILGDHGRFVETYFKQFPGYYLAGQLDRAKSRIVCLTR